MNSYSDHNYYLRKNWLNERKTKHHPRNCDQHHSFCNLDYQWAQQNPTSKLQSSLINQSIPNISLQKHQQRLITINYNAITEEDLDDWMGQSMNRNITSIINPQKQFFLPSQLEQDMKHRYRKKSEITKGDDDIYFTDSLTLTGSTKKKKKKRPQVNQLIFNYHHLEAKHIPGGTPIRFRQNKNKKPQIKRRNAILLQGDIHYNRLMRQMESSRKENQQQKQQQQGRKQSQSMFATTTTTATERMFYSYNIESLMRTGYNQETPASITENEFIRLKQPASDILGRKHQAKVKQQAIHEKFRTTVVDNTKNAQKKIIEINHHSHNSKASQKPQPKSTTQLQRTTFKLRPVRKPFTQNLSTSTVMDPKLLAKDRALQKKIILLLNDMQIMSQQIDLEMSDLNIHLTQVELTSIDSRPQTKWVVKAEEKLKANQIQLAIDCYKQALIIQPEFFVPIFNIASLLEKEKQYSQAKRWFEICKQFGIDEEMVKFGLAIVSLKQMKFRDCYAVIEEMVKKNQTQKKMPKLVYYYIRALCAKKLGKYDQARNDYSVILKNCKPSYFGLLNSLMVSTLLSKSRRLALKFDALSYLKFTEILYIVYFTPEQKLKSDNEPLKSIAKKLANADFFKRFSISLVEKLLQSSTYESSKPDTLIFVNDDQTVILLSGMIIVRNHLHQFSKPETVSVLQQGGVIGGGKIDNFINEKSNNWFITKSQVELIKVHRKSFNEFWKGQITFEMDFKYNFIKNVELFKNLSQWALFNICEKVQKVKCSYGTILYNDCSYRNELINKTGSSFGMGKKSNNLDPRFINLKKVQVQKRKKTKCRIAQLLKKHYVAFSSMKFSKLKYPGLYIVINGKIQIEDDRGFRCSDLIGEREYFGQNLIIDSDGFHRYGRMIVASQHAQLYMIPVDRLGWMFNEQDKQTMRNNTKNRQSVQTVRFLRSRFIECQNTRINYKYLVNLNYR